MKRRIELPDVDQVQLPHIFGLRPGVLILVILLVVLVAAIFFIAFFPGIIKGGRYVTFRGQLSESGVQVDGTYLGATDYQFFIGSGSHEVQLMKAGIPYASYTLEVDHPVFLTWLFHRKQEVAAPPLQLDETTKESIIHFNLQEVADASAILHYDAVTRYRPVFANLVQDLRAMDKENSAAIDLALRYITNESMLEDAKMALQTISPTEAQKQLLGLAEEIIHKPGEMTYTPEKAVPVMQEQRRQLSLGSFELTGFAYEAASFSIGRQSEGRYPEVKEAPSTVQTPPFVLGSGEITQYQWALFLEENPSWDVAHKANLIEEGLVDESYLDGMTISSVFVTSKPVFNVSYYAAQAFCEWASRKSGKEVFLPTEAMWTLASSQESNTAYASSLSPSPDTNNNPVSLLGGVWEITQTPYIPLSRISGYEQSLALHQKFSLPPDPIVKGGSYLNDPQAITAHTVGVIAPNACGDQIGFRVAWYD
ncbi:MAG: formylglycine-generating enzyme family protein [Sphaerochaeta sp.]